MTDRRNESGEFGVSHEAEHFPNDAGQTPLTPEGAEQGDARNESGEFGVSAPDEAARPAQQSYQTGPKMPWGKAKSSRNALKHGLCAQAAIIPGEDPAELEALREELLADEKPQTAMERMLIDCIVMAGWRLRRASRYEGHLLTAKLASVRRQRANDTKWRRIEDPQAEAELDLPRAVDKCLESGAHRQMVRYENAMTRELFRAMNELRTQRAHADTTPSANAPRSHAHPAGIGNSDQPARDVTTPPANLPTRAGDIWPPPPGEYITPEGEHRWRMCIYEPPRSRTKHEEKREEFRKQLEARKQAQQDLEE